MERGLQVLNGEKKLREWTERIASCRGSGQTVSAWCEANGVSVGSYYRWQKRIYTMTQQAAGFVEITPQRVAEAITVRINGAEAEIPSGMDTETVTAVVRAMKLC